MLSKSDYAKLSKAGKQRVAAAGGAGGPSRMRVSGRGAYRAKPAPVRRPRIRGHGGYASDIGGAIGGITGKLLPIPGLSDAAKWAGSKLGGYIGKIFGSGSYKMPAYPVRKNAMLDEGQPIPQFEGMNHGTVVCHREFLQDVSGSVAFSLNNYPINVGLEGSFPWLSSIAANYEEYVIEGIIYEFVSTSADALNSTNTALGSVILATEYNAANPNFINKQQMLEYEFATSGRPSESQCHIVECARRETVLSELYVRTGSVPSGQDQRLFDLGNFQIATVGMQAAAVIGELWCSYKVRLLKPKLVAGPFGGEINWYRAEASAGISTSAYFGSSRTLGANNTVLVTVGATTLTFPQNLVEGNYLVTYAVAGTTTLWTKPTVSYTSGCSALSVSSALTTFDNSGTTCTVGLLTFGVTITAASAVVTFSSGTLLTSPTAMVLEITQIPAVGV